jgi:hypothetical protein
MFCLFLWPSHHRRCWLNSSRLSWLLSRYVDNWNTYSRLKLPFLCIECFDFYLFGLKSIFENFYFLINALVNLSYFCIRNRASFLSRWIWINWLFIGLKLKLSSNWCPKVIETIPECEPIFWKMFALFFLRILNLDSS